MNLGARVSNKSPIKVQASENAEDIDEDGSEEITDSGYTFSDLMNMRQ